MIQWNEPLSSEETQGKWCAVANALMMTNRLVQLLGQSSYVEVLGAEAGNNLKDKLSKEKKVKKNVFWNRDFVNVKKSTERGNKAEAGLKLLFAGCHTAF